MKVEVVRSARRRKTVQARLVGDVVRISIPGSMSREEERKWVSEMVGRMERKSSASTIDLTARAAALATRHRLESPASIRWVDNQEWRWGSCTPAEGSVRISSRLASEPRWVLDYVIVHELAHLSVAGHSKAFWNLVYRYPLAERARGFLIARSREPADEDDPCIPEDPFTELQPGEAASGLPTPLEPILDPGEVLEDSYPLVGTLF